MRDARFRIRQSPLVSTILGMLVLIFSCLSPSSTAHAENYAFLVAVQDYSVKNLKPLRFTRNDIQQFSKLLQGSGFKAENIVLMTDKSEQLRYAAEADKIRKQFDTLLTGLEESDTLVVAFAGHGVQFEGDDKNYYCPVDADLEDSKHLKLIAISEIYEKLKACPAQRKLLVVDACRKDPLSELARSRSAVTLKSVTRPQAEAVPKGVVALFSCAAGQEAFEWPELKHGIFFHHFLEGWQGAADDGDLQVTLDEVVAYARKRTQSFARLNLDASQTPQLKSDFEGTWVLRKLEKSSTRVPLAIAPFNEEAALEHQRAWAKYLNVDIQTKGPAGLELRLIPPGEFEMGSNDDADDLVALTHRFFRDSKDAGDEKIRGTYKAEQPLHKVKISHPFYLGKYEVTKGEFSRFVEDTNHVTDSEKVGGALGWDASQRQFLAKREYNWKDWGVNQKDESPVVIVSWNDAVKFCAWLTKREGKHGVVYRLPTEAEWEYACRAGTTTRYCNGNSYEGVTEVGNVADAAARESFPALDHTTTSRDGYDFTAPRGRFARNGWGLYDMHGNVYEWCSDWYHPEYYKTSPGTNPPGPDSGERRIYRGGSWTFGAVFSRSSFRGSQPPGESSHSVGFRVVRTVPEK